MVLLSKTCKKGKHKNKRKDVIQRKMCDMIYLNELIEPNSFFCVHKKKKKKKKKKKERKKEKLFSKMNLLKYFSFFAYNKNVRCLKIAVLDNSTLFVKKYRTGVFFESLKKKGTQIHNLKLAHFSVSKKENLKCRKCQTDMNTDTIQFVCKNCKALVDVDVFKRFNVFELFNLTINYDMDKHALKQKFTEVQKLFHPDKNIDSTELKNINEASSYLNDAYNVLNNDTERATYLLELLFNYKMEESENVDDEEFLTEIIKINEQIDNLEDIKSLTKQYEERHQKYIDELKILFKEMNCDNIVRTVKKLKFVDKILERIKNM